MSNPSARRIARTPRPVAKPAAECAAPSGGTYAVCRRLDFVCGHLYQETIQGRVTPIGELARLTGVHKRTLWRDLAFLRDGLGFAITFDHERDGYTLDLETDRPTWLTPNNKP